MKIVLFDSSTTPGDAQRFLAELAHGLAARKRKVVTYITGEGAWQGYLAAHQVPTFTEPLRSWLTEGQELHGWRMKWPSIFRLYRRFRQEEIGVLFANTVADALCAGTAMRLAGGRVFWQVHLPSEITSNPSVARNCYRLCEHVLVTSEQMAVTLAEATRERRRMLVAPPVIDLAAWKMHHPPVRKDAKAPVVGMIGPWAPRVGQQVLIKAFRDLQLGGTHALLRMAGTAYSTEEERYRSVVVGMVKAAGLGEWVVIDDMPVDIPAFLAGCDVVVIPALSNVTARIALEAAATGRPVIASRLAEMAEVVQDGHTGLLVPPNHSPALSDALALLLASPALRAEMGRQARIYAEEHFSLERLLDIIEGLLDKDQKRGAKNTAPAETAV
ncbi:MAG: glycosyltransferase family 4 protein [Armatimonadota bacterium]